MSLFKGADKKSAPCLFKMDMCVDLITVVSYKWYSVAGLPNLYSVIDGWCTLKVENNCYTENSFYMKQVGTGFVVPV